MKNFSVAKKNVILTVILAIVIFASGVLTGFFAGPMMRREFRGGPLGPPPSPEQIKHMMRQRIVSRLDLSAKQCAEIEPVIEIWYRTMENLRREHAPLYEAAFKTLFDSLQPFLNDEQRVKLTAMRKEMSERHKRFHNKPERAENSTQRENTSN
ncbi:MAG: hypothetical protein JXR78_13535 [Victivallales bacterium]|nr:hypothetical protein [Victivallales bacterium]